MQASLSFLCLRNYIQLELNAKNAANAQRSALKMDISVATKLPTNNLDEANEKLRRLQELKVE